MLLENPNVAAPLNQKPEDFPFQPGPVADEDPALSLVIQDTQRAEKFVTSRLWMSEWRVAKALYEAPIKQEYWRDTLVPRASNSFPLAAQHVRAIHDQVMPALFPEEPPFMLQPRPGVSRQAARAWEEILAFQLKETGFRQQVRLLAKDGLVFGTGIAKFGWEKYPRKTWVYQRNKKPVVTTAPDGTKNVIHTAESDDLKAVQVDEMVSRPFFKRVEINHLLVAPGLREPNVQKAAYVVYRDYLTIRDLNKLRDFEGYDIPSEKELIELATPPAEQAPSSPIENEATGYPAQGHRPLPRYLDESEDPLEHKLEVLEHVTPDTVIVALQRKKVIRNQANDLGVIPFLSCFWDDIPGTFYGFGIPRRIGSIQIHIQGLRNLRLDDVNLNLQNMWLEVRGANISGQPLRMYPGARIKVDQPNSLTPLVKQPVLGEAYREESVLIADAEKTTGANELLVQGSLPAQGRTSMGRTAGGAAQLGAASNSHIQSYVDNIVAQVIMPALNAFVYMDREFMDPATMRDIVGQTLWQSLENEHGGDLLVDMCNHAEDLEFSPLAGTSIAAKRNLATSLPLEMQMFQAPAVQQGLQASGLKVNWLELSRRMEQVTGWKSPDDVLIPMTPADAQRQVMMNPEIIKGKVAQQRIAQLQQGKERITAMQHQNKLEETDAQGLAGAGSEIITRAIERAAQAQEMGEISGTL